MEYSPLDPDAGSGFYLDLNVSSLPVNYTTEYPVNNITNSNDTALVWVAFKSIAIIFIIITAIFGNILVIISVIKFRNLRIISNFFIMSLATADLLVSMLVMPFNASQEIVGHWVFSNLACDIFNANDVLFCTASLLHLCCISMDRYIAITYPFKYHQKMTRRRVAVMLLCAWGASALISHIPIHTGLYASDQIRNGTSIVDNQCLFDVNMIYALISSTISFWIPAFIMVFTYFMIFREARRQEKRLMELTVQTNSPRKNSGRNSVVTPPRNGHSASLDTNGYQNSESSATQQPRLTQNKMKREHKAMKTLGIIMGCFLLCWLPFFLWYVITTICGDELCPTPPILSSMLFWIGYFNSALNPMIYAFFNKDFRNAFKTLLRCQKIQQLCCKRPNQSNNSRYYQEMENRSARPSLIPRPSLVPRSASLVPSSRSVHTYDTVD